MAVVNWSLQAYTDTAANLNARATPILEGQLAIETDTITTTPKFKIGDGVSLYSALPYFYGGASSAQNLQNVLSIGSSTGGLGYNITLTTGDVLYIGNNTRSIYSPALGTTGITLDNTNSSEYIILKDAGGVDFSGTTVTMAQLGYLNGVTSSIQTQLNNKQPLDVDLTSWAAITRASGFDTFATTPSSANLASLVTGETGSGALVFGTSPTFTTDITTPKINGVSGNILLTNAAQTSGAITNFTFTNSANTNQTSGSEISNFKVNGASKTWAAGAITTQRWNYFTANTAAFASASSIAESFGMYVEAAIAGSNANITNNFALGLLAGTATIKMGNFTGSTTASAIYMNQAAPSTTNYTLYSTGSTTQLNTPSGATLYLTYVGSSIMGVTNSAHDVAFNSRVISSGATIPFTFTIGADTGQTASTEIPNFKITGNTKTWASGAITTQRWNYFTANTAAFASTSTITNSYGLYVEAATAGTNATITNNWALGTNGGIFLNGTANTVLGSAALATTATSGFLHVPSCAGVPTGVPTLYTGMIPIVCDSTNNKMYIYSGGAWVALN